MTIFWNSASHNLLPFSSLVVTSVNVLHGISIWLKNEVLLVLVDENVAICNKFHSIPLVAAALVPAPSLFQYAVRFLSDFVVFIAVSVLNWEPSATHHSFLTEFSDDTIVVSAVWTLELSNLLFKLRLEVGTLLSCDSSNEEWKIFHHKI